MDACNIRGNMSSWPTMNSVPYGDLETIVIAEANGYLFTNSCSTQVFYKLFYTLLPLIIYYQSCNNKLIYYKNIRNVDFVEQEYLKT